MRSSKDSATGIVQMPGDKTVQRLEHHQRFSSPFTRAGLAFLFSAILLIPRVRRLRRRVLVWTLMRVLAGVAGAWLAWRFAHGTTGIPSLLLAIGLVVVGLLAKARPERRSIDDVARELSALVVLNGGSWVNEGYSRPVPETSIFVVSDRVVVFTAKLAQVAEIPLARVRQVSSHAIDPGTPRKNGDAAAKTWQTEVTWNSAGDTHRASFRFDGFFAEHLARVAELTITSVWKKHLPLLRS